VTEDQTILLVDDSDNDLVLMRIAFAKAGFTSRLQTAANGEEAIEYLKGGGRFQNRNLFPLPTVVLLDLNMPKKTGFDVLSFAQNQPAIKKIPIIVLTASIRLEDVERAFELRAHGYLVKPSDVEELIGMVRCLRDWLQMNQFPPLHEAGRRPL
jgi:CheY-like chemotaxis protein